VPRKPKPTHCATCGVGGTFAHGLCRKHYDAQRKKSKPKPKPKRYALAHAGTGEGTLAALAAILRDTPKLDGLCKAHPDANVFDGETEADVAEALVTCARCPFRRQCADWAMSDESGISTGIVGGLVLDVPARREASA
jgi:hypothetical protein